MTAEHIFYIPVILMLGFILGYSQNDKSENRQNGAVSTKRLTLAFLVFLIVFIVTHAFPVPSSSKAVSFALGGVEIFDKKASYSSDEVYSRLDAFRTEGIEQYKQFTYTIDVIFPLSMLYFLLTLSRFICERRQLSAVFEKLALIVPVIWFSFDMAENIIIFSILTEYPVRLNPLAGLLGYVTFAKYSLLIISLIIPVGAFFITRKISQPNPDLTPS